MALLVTLLGINVIGDWLRDTLDPHCATRGSVADGLESAWAEPDTVYAGYARES